MRRISAAALFFLAVSVVFLRWAYSENAKKVQNNASDLQGPAVAEKELDRSTRLSTKIAQPSIGKISDSVTVGQPVETLRQRAKDIAACLRLQDQKRVANSLLTQSTYSFSDYARDRMDQNLQMASARINKLQGEGACNGVDTNTLTGAIYPLLLEMARKGDAEAANCYVAADFELNDDQRKPDQIEEYRRNATALVKAQMEAGDWRMVALMKTANDRDDDPHRGRYSWFREISVGNPARAYGYSRLLRLGATDGYGAGLDHSLDARKAELSPAQIAEQDQWAEWEYRTHFAHSPPINEQILTCALHSDTRVYHHVVRSPD